MKPERQTKHFKRILIWLYLLSCCRVLFIVDPQSLPLPIPLPPSPLSLSSSISVPFSLLVFCKISLSFTTLGSSLCCILCAAAQLIWLSIYGIAAVDATHNACAACCKLWAAHRTLLPPFLELIARFAVMCSALALCGRVCVCVCESKDVSVCVRKMVCVREKPSVDCKQLQPKKEIKCIARMLQVPFAASSLSLFLSLFFLLSSSLLLCSACSCYRFCCTWP